MKVVSKQYRKNLSILLNTHPVDWPAFGLSGKDNSNAAAWPLSLLSPPKPRQNTGTVDK